MRRDFDMIQFESRVEIGEVIRALEEWKETHKNDQKMETDRKSTRLNSSHMSESRMPSSA